MGTNVYFLSKNRNEVFKYFGDSYELTDSPYFAYEIHVLKRSCGWIPLWQAHEKCKSVKDYKNAYDSGFFEIYDEYSNKYTWDEFWEQFAMFNGGVLGAKKPEKIEQDKNSRWYDKNMPDYCPVSHISGSPQSYKYNNWFSNDNFKDPDGFEFSRSEFS